jgi:hypothetical protein
MEVQIMTPKEQVLKAYPQAHLSESQGKFRIVRPKTGSDKPSTLDDIPLTRTCDTEEEAWRTATLLPKVRGV